MSNLNMKMFLVSAPQALFDYLGRFHCLLNIIPHSICYLIKEAYLCKRYRQNNKLELTVSLFSEIILSGVT